MSVIAIGDIHGCLTALRTLERTVPLGRGEVLVTLGDYVDRGPQSREVLEWLIAYRENGGQLVPLLGNHELMMLRARRGVLARNRWLANGGIDTLRSYAQHAVQSALETQAAQSEQPPQPAATPESAGEAEQPRISRPFSMDDVPAAHWSFLESCLPFYETETHLFVHANLHHERAMQEQTEDDLFWQRLGSPQPHVSGKHMICGHTPQPSGEPRALPHATCIDTFAYDEGWLTALEVETGRCWQANERGEARTGLLELDP